MSRNIRIAIVEPPSGMPAFYADSDGRFSFDLFEGTDVAITKQVDEASEVGKMRQDTVKDFEIPLTNKNRLLINGRGNPQAFNKLHAVPFAVEIFVGDLVLPEKFARVTDVSDEGGFQIEVSGDAAGWIKPVSDLFFKDLDLGTFDFTEVNVEALQEFSFSYADGGSIINFPLVNYGTWPLGDRVALEDFRAWFSVLGLLQAAFCSVGWTFRCPILETDYGRRLWSYILKEDFRDNSVSLVDKAFEAELTAPVDIKSYIGPIIFDDDFTPPNADPGGNYDNTTGIYSDQVTADFHFEGTVDVVSAGTPGLIIRWLKVDQFGNGVTIKEEVLGYTNDGTFEISLSAYNVNVNSTDSIVFSITGFALNTTTFQMNTGSKIWNTVTAAPYSRGDTIVLANLINENYTVIDFLKGIVHLFNLKFFTDSTFKTVWFYPENGAKDFYSEGDQESFFLPNTEAKDWTEKIQCRSLQENLSEKNLTNEYLLAFKATTDPGIKNLKLDLPLHSELIVRTEGDFKEGRTENRNPFFEPTRNDLDATIGVPGGNPSIPYIPMIWDSEPSEGNLLPDGQAVNIGPRIVLFYGYDAVGLSPEAAGSPSPKLGTYLRDSGIPKVEYLLSGQILKEGINLIPATGTEDEAIVYGAAPIRTDIVGNYEYLYNETIRTLYFGFPVDFLVLLTLNDLQQYSPRDRIFFRYFSEVYGQLSIFARIVKIEDFLINRELTTPVQLLPRVNFLDLCP